MKNLLEQLQQLLPLAAAATAAPWIHENDEHDDCRLFGTGADTLLGTNEEIATMAWVMSDGSQADAAFIAAARNLLTPENLTLLTAALAGPVADAGLLSLTVLRYEIECRKFGTAGWFNVAIADDEQEGLELLSKAASAWARHEHRMVSLVMHTRLHPLATAPTTPAL